MSEQNKQQVNEGFEAAKTGAKLGAQAGETTAKGGVKAGKWLAKGGAKKIAAGGKTAASFILSNPYVAIVVAVIFVVLILVVVSPSQGQISSTYRDTDRKTAINERSDYNDPETGNEKDASINSKELAIDNTKKLAVIIHNAKKEDYERVRKYAQAMVRAAAVGATVIDGADIDIDLSVQMASSEFTERSHLLWEGSQVEGENTGGSAGARAVAWGKQQLGKGWKYAVYSTIPDAACPICHPEKNKTGWQCIGFVTACYFHGAGVRSNIHDPKSKKECTLDGLGTGGVGNGGSKRNTLEGNSPEDIYKKWKHRNGNNWTMISCGSLKSGQVKESELQPGDVLLNYTSAGWNFHTSMYIGEGKCIECTGGKGVQTYKFSSRHSARIAMRYIDSTTPSALISSTGGISKSSADVINGACAWAEAIAADNSFHYGHGDAAVRDGCYFCGTNTADSGGKTGITDYKKSYSSTSFVHAAFSHGGGEPEMLKLCSRGSAYGTGTKGTATYHNSKLFKNLKNPSMSDLQKGDVLCKDGHVALYIGDGKIAHAAEEDNNVRKSRKWNKSIRVEKLTAAKYKSYTQVYRYKGKGGGQMEIPGGDINGDSENAAESLTPQSYRTTLKTISATTGTRVSLSASGNTAQSFVFADGKFYVQRITPGRYGSGGFIESYDSSGKLLKTGPHISQLGHGNGLGYKNGKLYSIWAGANRSKRSVQLIDPATLKYEGAKTTRNAASGIGYDKATDSWALNQRNGIVVYDGELKDRKQTIAKKGSHGADYVQDCMAENGVVYACIHVSGKNYIDLYRETDGAYLGSYITEGSELEGLTLTDKGELVLLYHRAGSREYIQFTGVTIDGGSGEDAGGPEYISSHDMDILAAYNTSIANAATFMNAEENKSGDPKETWLNNNAYYTDISGKKVKIYWEDKRRGLIDYEKDLKKKADAWFKGFISTTIETSDSSERSDETGSDHSSDEWNLLLVNPDHAMPDGYSPSLKKIDGKYLTSNDKWRNRIDSRVYDPLIKMMSDCKKAVGSKHAPLICSAYRTRDMQQELYDATANKDDTAVPGHSEHECGLAVDIVDKTYQNLDDSQADQKAQKWLMSHCQDYGFILRYPKGKQDITGIIWEPWHYRYVGKACAKEIMSKGITLEEYLGDQETPKDESSETTPKQTPSEEEMTSDKHFYKIVLGTVPEKVGDSYIIPVTIKEKEVNELMDPLFGVDPNEVYVNSQSSTQANSKDEKERKSGLTTTNLDAVYSLSDSTGYNVFETQIYSQNVGFNVEADNALGIQTIGTAQQQAILNQIQKTWPLNGKNPYTNGYHGQCLRWVVDIYNGAGFSGCAGRSVCCASKHRDLFAHKDRNIPPGAMIYSGNNYRSSCTCECGRNAGHVAIYLGNDKVAGSQSPYVMSLSQWTSIFGYGGWSFGGNTFN